MKDADARTRPCHITRCARLGFLRCLGRICYAWTWLDPPGGDEAERRGSCDHDAAERP